RRGSRRTSARRRCHGRSTRAYLNCLTRLPRRRLPAPPLFPLALRATASDNSAMRHVLQTILPLSTERTGAVMKHFAVALAVGLAALLPGAARAADDPVDLRQAVLVTPAGISAREKTAVTMLLDEVDKRAQIRWPQRETLPEDAPAVVVGE